MMAGRGEAWHDKSMHVPARLVLLLFGMLTAAANPAAAQQEGRDNAAVQAVEALEAYAVYKMGMYELARQRWEGLAAKHNATAMVNLAAMASQGQGGPRDEAAAEMWLRKAADLGDARAIEELARRSAPAKPPAAPSGPSAK